MQISYSYKNGQLVVVKYNKNENIFYTHNLIEDAEIEILPNEIKISGYYIDFCYSDWIYTPLSEISDEYNESDVVEKRIFFNKTKCLPPLSHLRCGKKFITINSNNYTLIDYNK